MFTVFDEMGEVEIITDSEELAQTTADNICGWYVDEDDPDA